MSDKYLNLVNSPIGAKVASTVGLPRPAVLRRFHAGDPIVPGPVLLGSTEGTVSPTLSEIVTSAGAEAVTEPSEGAKWGALILDARSVAAPADLANLRAFLTPQLRSLLPSARVIVLGRAPEGSSRPERVTHGADITVDTTRQALDGIVRSLAKELQRGATANLLWVEDEASLESAIRFFLSGRSAYVDGQPVLLGPGTAPAPK